MVKEMHPEAAEEAVANVIPQWLDAFKILLEFDPLQDVRDPSNWSGLAIRIQAYSVSCPSPYFKQFTEGIFNSDD